MEMTGARTGQKRRALCELAVRIRARGNCWLYPAEPGVDGFLGAGPIFIVGDQPSTAAWDCEHPHRRAFYDLLAAEGAGRSHLTDIYKRRGPSGELRNGLPQDFEEHLEILRAEVSLLNPTTILALGWDAYELLLKHTPELTKRIIRVWHFGTVRHGKLKEFQSRLRKGIAAARRLARPSV
jgi:uracil-DNA glycosylase